MPKAYRQNTPPTKEVPEPMGLGIAADEEGTGVVVEHKHLIIR
ncbi:MAG: hypothetical protein SNH94_06850 [Rikenellaceae bacterium]